MLGRISAWWTRMSPYYTGANKEVFYFLPIVGYVYYRISYGGKSKAEESSKAITLIGAPELISPCPRCIFSLEEIQPKDIHVVFYGNNKI
ncbi:hypothetical protein DNTS_001642 [Danionella cerebrum]|uniref:Uncharacterized protein n=1 Tax=Danionella cerebrum TaxID=2873325 RepID=A0A553R028_9TELE|nr:hypothetical protein DNTS_001642 [Danionella translucida]